MPAQTNRPADEKIEKQIATPNSVLVMTKTNLSGKTNGLVPQVQTKGQTTSPQNALITNLISAGQFVPRPVQDIYEAQVALASRGISSGSIDGLIGSQTRSALRAFQRGENLPLTGELDVATKTKLLLSAPPYTQFIVTTNETALLQPVAATWLEKSKQSRLDYESILELAAEKFSTHPTLLKQLNPSVNWTNVSPGIAMRVPNVEKNKLKKNAAFIRIRLAEKNLEAFDENTNLLAHFPCSIAQRVEKRPVGELHVAKLAPNPDYTFDPENFPESAEAQSIKTKLILPPGPNNPVGAVWIGLDKPGYGIHGTPKPEDVGRTESHGCFRLTNWNVEYLLTLVTIGLPVWVEP